ncbi:Hypothetical protein PBC10988_16130 [Planctomycetales bacterium 10988]|nr:Hypothetical protein PBC10988_16130 [Planctomycetales bacterium 10988]
MWKNLTLPSATKSTQHHDTSLQLEQLEERQMLTLIPTFIDTIPGPVGHDGLDYTEINGVAYFGGVTTIEGGYDYALWKSDGTSAGTEVLKVFDDRFQVKYLTNINGTLFFYSEEGSTGAELWKSDGTSAGTQLVKDINPGGTTSLGIEPYFTNVNGTLFFTADDGSTGIELWKSDGTSAGTELVKDIKAGTSSSFPSALVNHNGTLLFSIPGEGLYSSDGTSAGTQLLSYIQVSYSLYPEPYAELNGTLFFFGFGSSLGTELWRTDGTSAGTQMVKDIRPGDLSAGASDLININGTLFFDLQSGFFADDDLAELWMSDGTSAGTQLVKSFSGVPTDTIFGNNSSLSKFTNLNGTLIFSATTDGDGGLWKSDGSSSGTQLIKDFDSNFEPVLKTLVEVDGLLYFNANDGSIGHELWQSDGTTMGTQLVKDIRPGSSSSYPTQTANINNTFFFVANDGVHGREVWLLKEGVEQPLIVTGTDAGGPATVRVFDATGTEVNSFMPYGGFTGGVRIATGDINGDGVMDIVTAPGPGGGPHIQVFDSETGQHISGPISNFYAYAPNVLTGIFVAVGDVNNDGYDDIITAPDAGGGPHLKVYDGQTGNVITEFYAYAPNVTVGVRIAAGDIDGNGTAEIFTAAGPGGGPHIRVLNGTTGAQMPGPVTNFYAYAPNVTTGLYVAAGDVNGDGFDDIITSPGAGGGPHIQAFSSADGSTLQNFYAYHPNFVGGVRVGSADLNQDGFADIITVPGSSGGPHTRAFSGVDLSDLANFFSGSPTNTDGLFVAGGISTVLAEADAMSSPFAENDSSGDEIHPEAKVSSSDTDSHKKSWWDEIDEFYQSAERIDKLFSGLGIE